MMDKAEMETRFTYHAPVRSQPKKYIEIRGEARLFAAVVDDLCPDSREKSLAITKIEEACFWANAAIARRSYP